MIEKFKTFEGRFDEIPDDQMKGNRANVYKHGTDDFTANGFTSDADDIILVDPDNPKYGNVIIDSNFPYLEIRRKNDRIYIVPVGEPNRVEHMYMFGGNFVYSSDSTFPFKYPIPIHDRYE